MQRNVKGTWAFVAIVSVASLAACATQTASAPAPAEAQAAAEAKEPVVGPPDVAWDDMTKEQRGKYMKHVVTPRMHELFAQFDAAEFKGFDCKTCHGAGADDYSFKMPADDLPTLPTTPEGWAELQKEHPRGMKFMAEVVTPEMARLVGKPVYDPTNPNPQPGAVGCMACHTAK